MFNMEISLASLPLPAVTSPFLQAVLPLFGKRLDSPEVLGFLEAQGFKIPKKFTTTPNSGTVYVSDKKRGIEFSFGLGGDHPRYPEVRAARKNSYVPILECVFLSKAFKEAMPFDVSFGANRADMEARFGPPFIVEAFRDDQGQPELVRWTPCLDSERDLIFSVEWWTEGRLGSVYIAIRGASDVFLLHDPWEERSLLEKNQGLLVKPALFVEWAITRGHWREIPGNAEGLRAVREGRMNGIEFILKHIDGCRIWSDQMDLDENFLHEYHHNMPPLYVSFGKDFTAIFTEQRGHLDPSIPAEELEEPYPQGPVFSHYLTLYQAGRLEGLKATLDARLATWPKKKD